MDEEQVRALEVFLHVVTGLVEISIDTGGSRLPEKACLVRHSATVQTLAVSG